MFLARYQQTEIMIEEFIYIYILTSFKDVRFLEKYFVQLLGILYASNYTTERFDVVNYHKIFLQLCNVHLK